MHAPWWKNAIAYQIYPRSFYDSNGDGIGDLQGVIQQLDYLVELGIDLIWLCPLGRFFQRDSTNPSDQHYALEGFGSVVEIEQLLVACHHRSIRLVIDLVMDHTSDEHPWFIESRENRDSEKRDWYIWREGKKGKNSKKDEPVVSPKPTEPNNWESIFGGSAWQYDEASTQYYLHFFSRKQPDLNWENPEMRQAFYQMLRFWLDKGMDGFRLNGIHHLKKKERLANLPNPKQRPYVSSEKAYLNVKGIEFFLHELREQTFAPAPQCLTIGDARGVKAKQAEDWANAETGIFRMMFSSEHLAQTEAGMDLPLLKKTLTQWQHALEISGWNGLYLENPDQARAVSRWGNVALFWRQSATCLATLYFLMKGTPWIYQGQEIGMTNAPFGDHRNHARAPMQWHAGEHAGFSHVSPWTRINPNYLQINVAQQRNDPQSVLSFYKKLIRLRKTHSVLRDGAYQLLLPKHPQLFAYSRSDKEQHIVVVCNLSDETCDAQHLRLPRIKLALLSNFEGNLTQLPPYAAMVYKAAI